MIDDLVLRCAGKRRALIPPEAGYVSETLKPIPEEVQCSSAVLMRLYTTRLAHRRSFCFFFFFLVPSCSLDRGEACCPTPRSRWCSRFSCSRSCDAAFMVPPSSWRVRCELKCSSFENEMPLTSERFCSGMEKRMLFFLGFPHDHLQILPKTCHSA